MTMQQVTMSEYLKTRYGSFPHCGSCVCQKCLYWWSGRCPEGECYDDKRAKEELVIGNRYKIRRPSIADGNVNSYQWSDATLVDISTHIAVFSVGEYCVTYKFCQLRDEVKEA